MITYWKLNGKRDDKVQKLLFRFQKKSRNLIYFQIWKNTEWIFVGFNKIPVENEKVLINIKNDEHNLIFMYKFIIFRF